MDKGYYEQHDVTQAIIGKIKSRSDPASAHERQDKWVPELGFQDQDHIVRKDEN